MAVAEQVVIDLIARTEVLERQLRLAGRNADRELSGIESRTRKFAGILTGLLAGISAAALVKQYLELADASKTLDAQLRLATAGFGTFAQATDDVRRISAETRAGLQETASLYGNFARAGKDLGATQDDVARATETFSKTLKISGADAGQAASATLQFGQALASGALRGDELNSVLEAAPRLTTLLTDSMGKSKGEIKALGEAGELTSDKLLNALTNKKFTDGIDAEFRELPVTFSDAMTQVNNAAIITFGAFDRGGQFSTALANFVTDGSDGFKQLEQDAVSMGIAVRSNIEGLVGAFGPIFDEAKRFFEYVNGQSAGVDIGRDIDKSLGQIDSLTDWLANKSYLGSKLNGTRFDMSGSNLQGRYRQDRDSADQRLRRENGLYLPGPANLALAAADRARKAGQAALAPKSTPASAKPSGGRSTANAAAAAERKAEQERLKAIRQEATQERDSARLDDDINAAKAALAVAAKDVLQFQLDAIESERKQQVADIETQVKLGQLGREEADRRILINSELAGLRNELVKRRAAEAVAAQQAARDRDRANTLQVEAQLVDSRKERRDVELRILDLAYKEEEAAIRRAAANGEIADLDEALANLRRRQSAETEGTNRAAEGPLARYRRDLNNPDRRNDAVENAVVDQLEGVRDSITSAAQKSLGIKNPILAAILNSFIEQQLIKPLLDSLAGAGSGGGSGLLGGLVSGVTKLFRPSASTPTMTTFPGFATGTRSAPRGLAMVGERGREIIDFDGGERVYNNAETNAIMAANAASMAGVSATRAAPVQQTVVVKVEANDYFDARVDSRAARVAAPIASRKSTQAGGASFAAGQQSTPATLQKYNQLKG